MYFDSSTFSSQNVPIFENVASTNLIVEVEQLPLIFEYCTPKITKSNLNEKIEIKTSGFD